MAKPKFNPDERVRLKERALELRKQGLGYSAIGRIFGVTPNTIKSWISPEYRQASNNRQRVKYSEDSSNILAYNRLYYHQKLSKDPKYREILRCRDAKRRSSPDFKVRRAISKRERYHSDIQFRIACCLRSRLTKLIKSCKVGSSVFDLGCSLADFREYIESKFKSGMSWDNHGEWHLDHIRPLASFDLSNRDEFLKAVHFTNIQPLWALENKIKGAKYV